MVRIVFFGSPDFAVPSLRRLVDDGYEIAAVVTQPDRPAGRGLSLTPPPVKVLAVEAGLPVLQPESLRGEVVGRLRDLAPDLAVVAAYGRILGPVTLGVPRLGVLNVHASLLPRWRGASPVQSAILAGDRETGVTIMRVVPELDAGPMLARRATPIVDRDTAGSLTDRLAEMGAELLGDTLPGWLCGEIEPVPQDERLVTYAERIDKAHGALDWARPAEELWWRVRAYTPWPGAFSLRDGAVLRVLEAWPLADGDDSVAPLGTVLPLPAGAADRVPLEAPGPAFAIQCGDGVLLPLKVQLAGKRPLFAAEFLRGERDLIGRQLG